MRVTSYLSPMDTDFICGLVPENLRRLLEIQPSRRTGFDIFSVHMRSLVEEVARGIDFHTNTSVSFR
jgi:hypothetical protein